MRTTVSTAIRASRVYVKAVGAVAAREGKDAADLVRTALNRVYGREINEQLDFFAKRGQHVDQSDRASDDEICTKPEAR